MQTKKFDKKLVDLWLNDKDDAHIMVILNEKYSIMIDKQVAKQIPYINKQCVERGMRDCYIAEQSIQLKQFQNFLSVMIDNQFYFDHFNQVCGLLNVAIKLGADTIKEKIIQDMDQNFRDYNIFMMLQISIFWQLEDIKYKCLYELIRQNFEQLNFNRFELLQIKNYKFFEYIIKLHEYLKNKNYIKGHKVNKILQIIQEFIQYHNIQGINNIFQIDRDSQKQFDVMIQQYDCKIKRAWIKFRTPSFDMTELSQSISFGQFDNSSAPTNSHKISQKSDNGVNTEQVQRRKLKKVMRIHSKRRNKKQFSLSIQRDNY